MVLDKHVFVQGTVFRNRMSQEALRAYAVENFGDVGHLPEPKLREKCTQHFVASEVSTMLS